jgi:hypothetical protein
MVGAWPRNRPGCCTNNALSSNLIDGKVVLMNDPGVMAGRDLDQLRRNLELSPTERVDKMLSLYNQLREIRGVAIPEGRRTATLQAIDALADGPMRSA